MSRYIACLLALSAAALPAYAADRKFDADAAAKAVAPYLDEQTFAVAYVDLTAVDVGALVARAADLAKVNKADAPFPYDLDAFVSALRKKAGARDAYVVFSLADVPVNPPFLVLPIPADAGVKADDAARDLDRLSVPPLRFEARNGVVVGGAEATLKRLHDLRTDARPDLAAAFAAADANLARLVVAPPKDAGKVIEDTLPTLPPEVGGGSSRVLTRGFRWAALGVDAPSLDARLTVQATGADAAKGLLDLAGKTLAALGQSDDVRTAVPEYSVLKDLLTPKIAGDRLTLAVDAGKLAAPLRPLLVRTLATAERAGSMEQLHRLGAAALNYEAAHRTYPPAYSADKNGKPLLSWRVHLLPFLGEEKLYKEFRLDEPWDGEHNKALVGRMPAVFRSTADPKLAERGMTTFLAPVGDDTMFPGARGVQVREVADGTSVTILFVQADDDRAVVWTKPDDLKFDAKDPWDGLGGRWLSGFLTAFADGSVHFVPKSFDKFQLPGLFTRNGGEVVNVP